MFAERDIMSSVIPWFEVPTVSMLGGTIESPILFLVGGALVGLAMARQGARRAGLSPRHTVDAMAATMLSALLLGRVTEIFYYPTQFQSDWRLLWRGGFTSLGVLLGAALALAMIARASEPSLGWRRLDVLVPAALLGGAVVRIGCFLGHHHAGCLTSLPGAVAYPGGSRLDLGLCEALLLFAIFIGCAAWARRWRKFPGRGAMTGVTAYAVGRFALEFLRGHDLEIVGRRSDARYLGLTLVQLATAAGATLGIVWLWRRRERTRPGAQNRAL